MKTLSDRAGTLNGERPGPTQPRPPRRSRYAKTELEAAIQRYVGLFDLAPIGYVTFDSRARVEEVNLAAARLLGRSRRRLIGSTFAVCVVKEDLQKFLHHVYQCHSSDESIVTELRLKRPNGEEFPVQLSSTAAVTMMKDGARSYLTAIIDLTERERAEQTLRAKEAELELIVTQTPFMLTRCSRDLRYRYVSRSYAKMVGYSPQELAGKPIVEILGKQGLAAIEPYIKRALRGQVAKYEALVPFADGKARFLQGVYMPDKNEDGEVVGWIGSLQDISDRKKVEERFRVAVEASPNAVILVDQARKMTLVNSQLERLFGYARQELLGKSVEILIPERFRPQFVNVPKAKTLGVANDLFALRKDRTEVPVEVGLNPIHLEGQRFTLVSIIDITERKKAREKIDANLKAVTLLHDLGEFCGRPAHNFQSCLQKILETAITIANADKGNLQIVDQQSGALKIAVQSGFSRSFLKFFSNVNGATSSACETAWKNAKYTIVEDVTRSKIFAGQPSLRILLAADVRAVHSIPLKSTAGNLVGVLSIHFSEPHRPQQREVGFMDLLARQAADYLERKTAENALVEAARQQASLYQLARRWQTAGSLDDVYAAALDAIVSAMRCDRASILLYDQHQVMRFVAWRGLSAAYRKAVEGHSPWIPGAKNPQPTCIVDMRLADIPESLKRAIRREGVRAAAFIPLVCEGELIGKFMMYHRVPYVFTDVELDLAMTIARQLVQAIEHEKHEEALRERERELARELHDQKQLQRISGQLITQQKIETIYTRVVEATMALMRSDYGSMQMVLQDTDELLLLAQKGFAPGSADGWRRIARNGGGTTCAEAFRRGGRVIVPDVEQCDFIKKEDLVSYRRSGIRSVQSTPLYSRAGELVGMISTHWRKVHQPSKRELRLLDVLARQAADLIESKRADDEVRESEARLRATVEQATAGVVRGDLNGRIVFVNQKFCQMLGYTQSELLGKLGADITHPEDVQKTSVLFDRLIKDGRAFEIEKRYIRKDGSIVWADVSAGAVRGADGKTQSTVAFIVDVTARREAEAELQKANEELERRVRERTRELHMTNKQLQSEIERRKGLEGEILSVSDREQQRLGQELHDGLCQHLTAVAFMTRSIALRLRDHRVVDADDIEKVAELVNKAAIDTRNLSRALHRVDVDAAGLVVALQDLADREIWRTPCRLEAKPSFRIDDDAAAAHLYRIAREAVINANKHAHGREIVIKLERVRREMVLRVIDDGMGLPKEVKPQQGLGFHIMNYRAQLMGGRLEIDSPATGGTRVSCYVPHRAAQSKKVENGDRLNGAMPGNSAVPVGSGLSLRHLARRGAANA